jgi:hypothetical protein
LHALIALVIGIYQNAPMRAAALVLQGKIKSALVLQGKTKSALAFQGKTE